MQGNGMECNVIDAIVNLVGQTTLAIGRGKGNGNRANDMGTAFEDYIKDLFAGSCGLKAKSKMEKWQEVFSYLGNNSNPPDIMLKNGDAVEVKKIQTKGSRIALNSSYPKHTLKSTNPLINNACKEAEAWTEKDMIYAVGTVDGQQLRSLCMVYGTEYCASDEVYLRIRDRIKDSVENTPGVESEETREIGHINKVDPLGVTYLRVRGMWGIDNPVKVFDYVYTPHNGADFNFMCIVNDTKWESLNNKGELVKLVETHEHLNVSNVKVKDPDNPARLKSAKLITYYI